jgi:ribosomal-protein-alanine N-acetyltransferase
MQHIVDTAISGSIPSIWLEMRPSNEAAGRLYRRMGFVAVGSRKNYYPDTQEDALIMVLGLAAGRHAA